MLLSLCLVVIFLVASVVGNGRPVALSLTGMTVLRSTYSPHCFYGKAIRFKKDTFIFNLLLKRRCDGNEKCEGALHIRKRTGSANKCGSDIHIVARCENGEIRSISIEGDKAYKTFLIDCRKEELPLSRDNSKWMTDAKGLLSKRRIPQLRLTGTHDSGTSGFKVGCRQRLRVGQQLRAGIRYLQFTIGMMMGEIRVVSGAYVGQMFIKDLLEIWAFARFHPLEFFIVHITEDNSSSEMHRIMATWIHVLFSKIAIKRGSIKLDKDTIQSIITLNRSVMFIYNEIRSYEAWPKYTLNTHSPKYCVQDLKTYLRKMATIVSKRKDKITMAQWIFRVNRNCFTDVYSKSLASRDDGINMVHSYNYPFTIILTDFTLQPLYERGIIEQMITANYRKLPKET